MLVQGTPDEPWAELWSNGTIVLPVTIQHESILELKPEWFEPYTSVFGKPLLRRNRPAWFRFSPTPEPDAVTVIQVSQPAYKEVLLTEQFALTTPSEPGPCSYHVKVRYGPKSFEFVFKLWIV